MTTNSNAKIIDKEDNVNKAKNDRKTEMKKT
jgi:hypothetical protein